MSTRRYIAALCLAAPLPGCTSWGTPRTTPPDPERSRVRVTTCDGERFVLRDPRVFGDEFVGTAEGLDTWRAPLRSIRTFETERLDGVRTLLFLTASMVVTVPLFLIAVQYGMQHE